LDHAGPRAAAAGAGPDHCRKVRLRAPIWLYYLTHHVTTAKWDMVVASLCPYVKGTSGAIHGDMVPSNADGTGS
jgi:hypothetical protein